MVEKFKRFLSIHNGITSECEYLGNKTNLRYSKLDGITSECEYQNLDKKYQFTEMQIQAAKLKAMGYSLSQISQRLNRKPQHISVALKAFRETAKRMRKAVLELSEVGYWIKQIDFQTLAVKAVERQRQMLENGLWPFPTPPYGYVLAEDKKLKIDPEKAEVVRQIFVRAAKGETPLKFAKEMQLPHSTMYHIIRNPIYKDDKFGPLVDEKTWELAQKIRVGRKLHPAPFGFKWLFGHLVPKSEEAEMVRQIFNLRIQGKSIYMIAKETKKPAAVIWKIIRNSIYRGKIVPEDIWQKVQNIKINPKQTFEKRKTQKKMKLLIYLNEHKGAKTKEIADATEIAVPTAQQYLRQLEKEGLVEKRIIREKGTRRAMWSLSQS